MSKSRFIDSSWTLKWIQTAYYFHRERERERERERDIDRERKSSREWGGVMVLGKLSMPRRPVNLDNSRARAYCACSMCGCGCLDIFFSRLSFLSSFSLFGRRPRPDMV